MKFNLINSDIQSNYGEKLLKERGINDVEHFLNPTPNDLQSYNDLDNINKGISIIDNIISTIDNPCYGIVVDSDVDGVTSAAIFILYMKELFPNLTYQFFMHENKQHGFEDLCEEIGQYNFDFIVAPDSASNDAKYIDKLLCPVIVLDHHIVEKESCSNMCIINNQTSTNYKNKFLSGAGVVYQFCRALDNFYSKDIANKFIDLAAVGIIGDMMSGLEIENQYIWKAGLSKIRNKFLQTIINKQQYSLKIKTVYNEIDEYGSYEAYEPVLNPIKVTFYIVPLINSMIRVGTMEEKQRMLQAFINPTYPVPCNKLGCKGTMEQVCVESLRECINAKSRQNRLRDQGMEILEEQIKQEKLLNNQILFINLKDNFDFPKELNGLIATQLANKYKHPTMIGRIAQDGYIRGSIRGVNNSELDSFKSYLDSTNLMEFVMGHENAAGFGINSNTLKLLLDSSNKDLSIYNFNNDFYSVNFVRSANSYDLSLLIQDLDKYKDIWSQNCDEPLIYINKIHLTGNELQIQGKFKNTLKFIKNGITYIKYFAKEMIDELVELDSFTLEIIGTANMNEYMNQISPQIKIENYQFYEDSILDF